LEVSLLFGNESIARFDATALTAELRCHSAMRSFFNAAAQQLGTLNLLADETAVEQWNLLLGYSSRPFVSVESEYSKSDSREMPI